MGIGRESSAGNWDDVEEKMKYLEIKEYHCTLYVLIIKTQKKRKGLMRKNKNKARTQN